MTPELMENIKKAKTLKEVEEIYKPYKSKKKTKAMIAIEKGFGVVADEIKKNIPLSNSLLKEKEQEQYIHLLQERLGEEFTKLLDKYSIEEIIE
jgi:transcriptional accessory protein Tex/SPT6